MPTNKTSKEPPRSSSMSPLIIFSAIFCFRLVNALCIATFFQPDEYFQSLEPAWQSVFGPDSGAWITWEWREQLRSSIHPLLFAQAYRLASATCDSLHVTPATRAELLLAAPKILQALFAAAGDLFTFGLGLRVYGSSLNSAAVLALTLCSPWQWFCSTRTLSNSVESTLTAMALYFWPWDWIIVPSKATPKDRSGRHIPPTSGDIYFSLTAAAVACILRPTNIMVWIAIGIFTLYRHWSLQRFATLLQCALLCGSAVLVSSLSIDKAYYEEWTFPPFKFLYFNIVKSLAVFYGANRRDYYFTEGLPLLLTTALPFAVVGLWEALRGGFEPSGSSKYNESEKKFLLSTTVLTTVGALTLISHKEVRFIYPLLPILHVLAAKPLASFFQPFPMPAKKWRLALMCLVLLVNFIIAGYVTLIHQRGVIDVLNFLRIEQETRLSDSLGTGSLSSDLTVGFLMPCHSTPWRSHLIHPETKAWALTCEPPIDIPMDQRNSYLDEADVFYLDPEKWINENLVGIDNETSNLDSQKGPPRVLPEYIVFFEQLEPIMRKTIAVYGYRECWRGFNTHFHDDSRRYGDVIAWCKASE
ncbi:glycosyltransferase family 22 protein [Acrodontium crateriforme]|uniref:Mannosyltransferase n=1 Tax=Acrodontium crateriforme TaxID=150365 RepID=A0AAQ3M4H4_9PEZI|nr:glycosyltransferase family 22 protein [Acrodontium crateriforme]